MQITPPTREMNERMFNRILKERMTGPLTLWNGKRVSHDKLPLITDGSLGALVIPRKYNYYLSLGILFEESCGQARGPHISFLLWFQINLRVLFGKDGTLQKQEDAMDEEMMVKEAMGAFLQREIVHYYHIWTAIMKEQGKSSVVYDDSVLGKAIKVLEINVIPVVQRPE
jgi:hypothetical protein